MQRDPKTRIRPLLLLLLLLLMVKLLRVMVG
jgi:hypothetical protein